MHESERLKWRLGLARNAAMQFLGMLLWEASRLLLGVAYDSNIDYDGLPVHAHLAFSYAAGDVPNR